MENPLWNLILRVASAASGILLLLGSGLMLASYLGATQNPRAALIALVFACALSVLTIVALNLSDLRLRKEQRTAAEIAHQLAQGSIPKNEADTELLDTLKNVAEYLKARALVTDLIASGELPDSVAVNSDTDLLG